jgi:hypothetical protein
MLRVAEGAITKFPLEIRSEQLTDSNEPGR